MQSKKPSTKTPKAAETKVAPQAERPAISEVPASTRGTRAANAKRSAAADMTSGKHHHKTSNAPLSESATTKPLSDKIPVAAVGTPEKAMAAGTVNREQVAQLAHSYWAARGYEHGSHEDDWLQAERELALKLTGR